jgi:antitoxin YefM
MRVAPAGNPTAAHIKGQPMIRDIPITTARHEITSLPERLEKEPGAVAITRRGKPVLAVMPWELYESLIETLEILGDPELMDVLRQSIKEVEAGKGIPWEDAKRELGL